MSRLSPRRCTVILSHDRFFTFERSRLLSRYSAPSVLDEHKLVSVPDHLNDLGRRYSADNAAKPEFEVILSSHLLNCLAWKGHNEFKTHAQELGFANLLFKQTYGFRPDEIEICLSRGSPRGSRIACGISRTLINQVRDTISPLGKLVSIRPLWSEAVNHYRKTIDNGSGYFVLFEPERLVLVKIAEGKLIEFFSRMTDEILAPADQTLHELLILSNASAKTTLWICDTTGRFLWESPREDWEIHFLPLPLSVRNIGQAVAAWMGAAA